MSSTWFPARNLILLMAAAGLWACSDDSSGPPDPPDDDELPEFTAGDAQLTPTLRATIADLLDDLGGAAGAGDPELAGAIEAIGAAFIGEGRITGVTASSSSVRSGPTVQASAVDGIWGVFGASVSVFPDHESPVLAYYTGVVSLHGSQAAIGIKKAQTLVEIQNAHAEFPHPKAGGFYFQGRTQGWGAIDGYMQVIPKTMEDLCEGVSVSGVECYSGTVSAGLEILSSVPLQFSGNQATGSRQFVLQYGDVRGYMISVYCDESSLC